MSQRTALVQKLLLAGWLTLGTVVVWLLLAMMALGFVEKTTFSSRVDEQVRFRADGTPTIVTLHFDGPTLEWRTLDGRTLTVPDDEPPPPVVSLEGPAGVIRFGEGNWSQRAVPFVDNGALRPNWYFIHDGEPAGSGYFIGYDRLVKRAIGYIGRGGFRSDPPPSDEQFVVDRRVLPDLTKFSNAVGAAPDAPNWLPPRTAGYSADVVHLLSAGHLYDVDVMQRTVRDAWPDGDLISLGVAHEYARASARSTDIKRSWLVLRTRERIVVHGVEPGDERSFVLPTELRGAYLLLYFATDGTAIADLTRWSGSNGSIVRFDTTGKVVDRHSVELKNQNTDVFHQGAVRYIFSALSPGILPGGTIVFFTAAEDIAIFNAMNQGAIDERESGLLPTLRRAFFDTWPQSLVQIVLSAVLAGLCWRRQRLYTQRGTWAWMALVFLFGLPGWLGYLWHRRWPALAACPACGREAPRDRVDCAGCHAEFPLPSLTGAELFA
jgi:hypothetical protein